MKKNNLGIVGYGNMGFAIAQGIKNAYNVFAFDADTRKTRNACGIKIVSSLGKLFASSETILIAVKPQDLPFLIKQMRKFLKAHTLISIAAGVAMQDIEDAFAPKKVKVIRAMPNLFVRDADSLTAICKGQYATDNELSLARQLFDCLGKTIVIDEAQTDAITAISASAPGYISYLLEKDKVSPEKRSKYITGLISELIKAAQEIGLNNAEDIAVGIAASINNFFKKHPEPDAPAILRRQVTSKAGTTEAAIKVLESGGKGKLKQAVVAAHKRAREIASFFHDTLKRTAKHETNRHYRRKRAV